MNADILDTLKEVHGKDGSPIMYGTAGFSIMFFSNCDFCIFDDEKEVLHAVRMNTPGNPEYNPESPDQIMIKSCWYNDIKVISSSSNAKDFMEKWNNGFFSENRLTTEEQNIILNQFAKILDDSYQPIELDKKRYETSKT